MEFFRTYKKQIYRLLVIILVLLAFITVGKKTNATIFDNAIGVVVTPVQDAVSSITKWFGNAVSSVRNDTDLRKENEELKATIALLTQDIDKLSLYEEENKRLTELLEIKQKYADHTSTTANITAKDPGSFYDSLL